MLHYHTNVTLIKFGVACYLFNPFKTQKIMKKPKVGMRFLSMTGVHTITKLIDEYGGGFYHTYKDGNRIVKDAFMYNISFKRLQECGAIHVL